MPASTGPAAAAAASTYYYHNIIIRVEAVYDEVRVEDGEREKESERRWCVCARASSGVCLQSAQQYSIYLL